MLYISEEDYRTGRCHEGKPSSGNPAISGNVSSCNFTNMSYSAPVSVSGKIPSGTTYRGYHRIGEDVMCMSQTREERRQELQVYQKAKMEHFRRKCERELKDDYDAKLIAIPEATRMEIAEETRRIHEQLSTVYSEAYAKAAEEYSALEQQRENLKREFERLVQLREAVNSDIQRFANMVTTTTARGDNDDAVEPDLQNDPPLLEVERAPIQDGTVRVGLKWAKCLVCNLNQPDYRMEKGQCHAACICCGVRTPHRRCVANDVRLHQAALKREIQQDTTSTVTTSRTPTRKSPRLHIDEDDEVQEVPPPPKVIELVDLTSADGAVHTTVTMETSTAPVPTTAPTRRRGRPRLHRADTSTDQSGTERDDTQRM